ncbi:uncharacterized protein LACBIDRAFT_335727 [Laccaria bicolor S238N-H82]|uniref:Predicted protein n=1 Tax=Laccaria bicolor (strain S238N-H82 / ATCC MYA-4686) TaxID=486041 RepID=B0E382_LACBS|nr:uncharacterized protein LACBIDRAFT_335727 [Laccaria bicolor S238N-H82]EDQ98704.1 predicted protein [Laccaria bicolor S238N-H82]|eukprot:XP_001890650.1 predicted protein [Laccaria bicolor S238N-H82]
MNRKVKLCVIEAASNALFGDIFSKVTMFVGAQVQNRAPFLYSKTHWEYIFTLYALLSRQIFTSEGMYNSPPMIGLNCGFVITSRTSTFQVETQDYDDGHDIQWSGQFNELRWLPEKRYSRTDQPNFNEGFLTASFKFSAQNDVDVRCCLVRNGRSWSVQLATNPCLRLVGRTTPAMTSANWNHKTFAFRT